MVRGAGECAEGTVADLSAGRWMVAVYEPGLVREHGIPSNGVGKGICLSSGWSSTSIGEEACDRI
jgi:hypothetical protein